LGAGELTDRRCDFGRRNDGRRNLIEERLKEVMVAAIDEDYVSITGIEGAGCINAGKARADDDDARLPPD
jgi:hypothetical protein